MKERRQQGNVMMVYIGTAVRLMPYFVANCGGKQGKDKDFARILRLLRKM